MKTFFLILFFSKTVLLTPQAIDIHDRVLLRPDESLSAITTGATLQIDITKDAGGVDLKEEGVIALGERLRSRYPYGSVKCFLYTKNERKIILDRIGFIYANHDARLVLTSLSGINTDMEFRKVEIITAVPLMSVKVYWKNNSK
jgi:hypothetical protein